MKSAAVFFYTVSVPISIQPIQMGKQLFFGRWPVSERNIVLEGRTCIVVLQKVSIGNFEQIEKATKEYIFYLKRARAKFCLIE